jgi:hypothetical protein
MPIIFKSKLSSSVANQTFLDKTIDDIKKGKLSLYKITVGEADQVEDVQVFLNELADVNGVAGEGDTSAKTYANHNIIADGDDRKVAIGKLDAQAQINLDAISDLQSLSGVGANAEDLGVFTGVTIPDSSDIKEALQSLETAHEEVDQNVNDLTTLSGVAENSTNLGAFNHTIIADNETVKGALQDLEDGIKAINDDYGVANGLATLDGTGKVPSTQLPSYVDDVLEYANLAAFPVTGSTGIIYVALDTNKTYRWSGTVYIEVSPSLVASVNGYTNIVVLNNADIGLSNVTNDSQLKRAANDLNSFTAKATPVNNDVLIIEDSADSFNKKKITIGNLPSSSATLPTTTLGDLIVHNGTTNVRFPVGATDGFALLVDSTEPEGIRWGRTVLVGYTYKQTLYFTSSGTYTKSSSSVDTLIVEVVGGGGGGGGAPTTTAGQGVAQGGGSGGGYSKVRLTTPINNTYTVTIGAGGAGGTSAGTSGSAGGTSSISTGATIWAEATGGSFGASTTASTSPRAANSNSPGGGSVGDLLTSGAGGGSGISMPSPQLGGFGGGSMYGSGGRSRAGTSGVLAGQNGLGYGAGGGGAVNGTTGQAGAAGGNGSDGIIIVHEFTKI